MKIPEWAFTSAVEAAGVTCPKCGALETRSWYSASRSGVRAYILSVHEPCESAWVEYE